jgi:hypothetical protein
MNTRHPLLALAALLGPLSLGSLVAGQNWLQTTAPSTNWQAVASSADGAKLVAVVNGGLIYISADSGANWSTTTAPATNWSSVASSADGGTLLAAVDGGGLYISSDSGANWTLTSAPVTNWGSVACSADGTKLVAGGEGIFTSANSGTTWTETDPPDSFSFLLVSCSGDGTKLAVVGNDWAFHTSTNFGASWMATPLPGLEFSSIASSTDGTKLFMTSDGGNGSPPCWLGGFVSTSTNSGDTWTWFGGPTGSWSSIACSADGTRLVVAGCGYSFASGSIYTSPDTGVSWTSNTAPIAAWSSVASSADGSKLVAVVNGGGIYTSQTTPAPRLSLSPSGSSLLLSWSVPSMEFVLEENTDLTAPNWRGLTNTPTLNLSNLQYQVTVPLSAANGFYRLKH